MKFKTLLLCCAILLVSCGYLVAQNSIRIQKIASPPVVDGKLNDKCWETPALISEFYQREPQEGKPMTGKTEVHVCYDANYIYFGIKCYQEPGTVSAKEMARDGNTISDDRVQIILDTYMDHRNAYLFGINALGAIEDAVVSQNGGALNKNWNGLFEGKSKITEQGWEAEVVIPFKTIGFDKKSDRWGLFMNRYITRKREYGSWPVGNLNSKEAQVSDAGVMEGLEGITQGIGLDISPYLISGLDLKRASKTTYKINGGGDLFYQLTPSLKASLSVNTDFAETEDDARQINLTRFSLRLMEKRSFFLDGQNYFRSGLGLEGGMLETPLGRVSTFFSRRIGLNADGTPIPINYGAKLTGQIKDWNIGMVHVSDERAYGNSHFSVARISRNIGQQSTIGIVSTFGNAISQTPNMVNGLDMRLASSKFMHNKNIALVLYASKSQTKNIQGSDATWGGTLIYPNDLVNFRLGHIEVGKNFIAGIGFLPRGSVKESYGSLTIGPRPNKWGIRQYKFGGEFDYIADFANKLQTREITLTPVGLRFKSNDIFNYSIVNKYDFLESAFNIYSTYIIPAGKYNWWENQFSLTTDGSRSIYGQVLYGTGRFYTGNQTSFKLVSNWKVAVPLFLGATFSTNDVKLPQGDFKANIYQFNANFLFSPDLTIFNFIQYDSQSKVAGLQSRFKWILKPGNEIHIVWNSGFTNPLDRYSLNEGSLRFKLKYNIRF